ncbi:MAG TPA: S8 family serine peptidase, partial [Pyrinomonadaceae bacterium]|nr:S8 family serine peptidase [Pyrinomonadaceae bacterium]
MKKLKYPLPLKRVMTLALLCALCASLLLSTYPTQGSAKEVSIESSADKISGEVKKLDKDFNADAILQLNGTMSTMLSDYIKKNISLKESFPNLNAYAIKLKVSLAAELVKFPEVSFISIDKEVKKLGHVSRTTGTDAARNLGGKTTYDGAGIGIAVLDSGIDTTHKSFFDGKISSVSYSQDFTGENRTDDPFGHGTHVASAIVGSLSLQSGAYGGIAPRARVVNLRVLNSHGTGTVTTVLRALNWLVPNRAKYNIRVVNMSL